MDQEIAHRHVWDDLAWDFVRQFQYITRDDLALDNADIAPDGNSLFNLKKKFTESFVNVPSNGGSMPPG